MFCVVMLCMGNAVNVMFVEVLKNTESNSLVYHTYDGHSFCKSVNKGNSKLGRAHWLIIMYWVITFLHKLS